MIAALTGLGSTIANSRPMQYAIGAGLFILGFLYWLAMHDRRLLQNERARAERKARKTQTILREEIEQENDERLEQANATRDNFRGGVRRSSELSESKRSILIRD